MFKTSGILTTPAGNTLQGLDEQIANHGFTMPLDLGAKGSCMVSVLRFCVVWFTKLLEMSSRSVAISRQVQVESV